MCSTVCTCSHTSFLVDVRNGVVSKYWLVVLNLLFPEATKSHKAVLEDVASIEAD